MAQSVIASMLNLTLLFFQLQDRNHLQLYYI